MSHTLFGNIFDIIINVGHRLENSEPEPKEYIVYINNAPQVLQ